MPLTGGSYAPEWSASAGEKKSRGKKRQKCYVIFDYGPTTRTLTPQQRIFDLWEEEGNTVGAKDLTEGFTDTKYRRFVSNKSKSCYQQAEDFLKDKAIPQPWYGVEDDRPDEDSVRDPFNNREEKGDGLSASEDEELPEDGSGGGSDAVGGEGGGANVGAPLVFQFTPHLPADVPLLGQKLMATDPEKAAVVVKEEGMIPNAQLYQPLATPQGGTGPASSMPADRIGVSELLKLGREKCVL